MSGDIKTALGRAVLELTRDSIGTELVLLREELRGSVFASVGGYAVSRARTLRQQSSDGKLSPEDWAQIIEEIPEVARTARAEQQRQRGNDGVR